MLWTQGWPIELKSREWDLMNCRIQKLGTFWLPRVLFLKPVVSILCRSWHVLFLCFTVSVYHVQANITFLRTFQFQIYINLLISKLQFTNWSSWDLVAKFQEREFGWPSLGQIDTSSPLKWWTSGKAWEQHRMIYCPPAEEAHRAVPEKGVWGGGETRSVHTRSVT